MQLVDTRPGPTLAEEKKRVKSLFEPRRRRGDEVCGGGGAAGPEGAVAPAGAGVCGAPAGAATRGLPGGLCGGPVHYGAAGGGEVWVGGGGGHCVAVPRRGGGAGQYQNGRTPAGGGGGTPPAQTQRDHRGKQRSLALGNSCRAIVGTPIFGSQTPPQLPPLPILPFGGGVWHDAFGVMISSAAGGAYWPIAIRCPSLGPFPSVGGGAHRLLTAL